MQWKETDHFAFVSLGLIPWFVLYDTEYVADKMHPVTMIQGKVVMNILNSIDD